MLAFVVEHGIATSSRVWSAASIMKVATPMGWKAWGSPTFSWGAVVDVAVVHVADIEGKLFLLTLLAMAEEPD